MNKISFKEFLQIYEDVDQDIANLSTQKQQLLVRKAQQTQQIDKQINSIDKMLYQKQQQKQNEAKQSSNTQTNNVPANSTGSMNNIQ